MIIDTRPQRKTVTSFKLLLVRSPRRRRAARARKKASAHRRRYV